MSTREWAPRRTQINAHSLGQELALQVRCRVGTLPTLAFLQRTQKRLLVRLAIGRGRRRVVAGGSLMEGSQRSLRELVDPTPYLAGGDGGGATAGVPPTESAKGHHATAQGTRRAMSVNLPPHLSLRHLRRLRDLLHVCRVDLSPFYYAAHNFPDRTTTWESRQPPQGVRRRIQMADDRPAPTAEQIRSLWEALDRPGPEKLQVALRKRGFFAPTVKVLRDHFYKFQSSRQVFQRPPKYTGHAYSTGLDDRWMADVMVMPEAEFRGKSYKYALVVVDIFSRFAWAALIDSPMQADEGFREILRKAGKGPGTLITDGDPGFKTRASRKSLRTPRAKSRSDRTISASWTAS